MARIARIVVPGMPHHLVQRGNRRMETFFSDNDYREYLALTADWCGRSAVQVWAYCLMPNHVHLIVVPESEDGLRRAIGEAHRRYSRYMNFQKDWHGHLWQGRFASYPMDEPYMLAAARYIELNPVRAALVTEPSEYLWSSAGAHLRGEDDVLVRVRPLLDIVPDWSAFLAGGLSERERDTLRRHEKTGRPLGDEHFVASLERLTDRVLARQRPGPKRGE